MRIRIKKQVKNKTIKLETFGKIEEIMINENFINPGKETISLCFRSDISSGIIDIDPDELEKLYNGVKNNLHLIKGVKNI